MTGRRGIRDLGLSDPDVFVRNEQHEIFRILRAEDPVHWDAGRGQFRAFWSIVKYDDIIAISRDPAGFISGHGITMGSPPDDPAHGRMMIMTDPPRHVRLRRLVNKGFTPRMVAQLEPHIRRLVVAILDDVAARAGCDFVTDVAARLPLAVICELMGVPAKDEGRMFELTNRFLGAGDPEYQTVIGDIRQTIVEAEQETFRYFAKLLAERRRERREDLVSILADAEVDGDRLTDEDILFFCLLLIAAGNETTRNAITGGMLALIEHPEQRQRLLDDRSLLPTAIEEILRWTSPVLHMARTATRDVELRGQTIHAGDRVILWYPSANRDENIFPDPYRFDLGRTPNEHLAFGIGEHFCLGAGLARLEMRVMFEELLDRLPAMALAGPVERLRSSFICGIKHMPVRAA